MSSIGILDPDGVNLNPLNGKEYSDRYRELAKVWRRLPGYERADEVIRVIKENQIVLIIAETGSGKTVLVPKFALHALDYNVKIAITLPKQIITKASASYAAETLDVKLGEEVGYQYKGSPSDSRSSTTKLLYATDGTIVARLLNDPKLTDFDVVIIDEAHERKIQIDFLLYLLRAVLTSRPEFKLIIMSATINADIFKRYFDEFKFAEVMMAGKTNYPIKSIFIDKPLEYRQILSSGYDKIVELLNGKDKINGDRDIMFFVTSSNDAFNLCQRLYAEGKYSDVFCVEVYSGMNSTRQRLAQDRSEYKKDGFVIKLVIATNVAESSLTIDGIKYVLDSGYELRSSYDPEMHADKLELGLISNAQAKQRMGRAGRTGPGVCYHFYTKDEFENGMEKFPQPDIRVSDLSSPSLRLLSTGVINTVEDLIKTYMKFIEPPKEIYIKSAINDLIQLGAISLDGITPLGKLMAEVNLDPMPALSVIIAKIYNCSNELINILSVLDAIKLNMNSLFITPASILKSGNYNNKYKKTIESQYEKVRTSFRHKYGDHISILNIYINFNDVLDKYADKPDYINDWVTSKFLKLDPLMKARAYAEKLRRSVNTVVPQNLKAEDIGLQYNEEIAWLDVPDRIMTCLVLGYRLNRAFVAKDDMYRTKYTEGRIRIDRNSFLMMSKSLPTEVVYSELFVSMGRSGLNIVSKIPDKIREFIND
jgi:pre-mRNA-splicing factor ATP-dependent RNA helicase DHX15/PRP43